MSYDKDKLKNSLTIDEVFTYITDFGGEPVMMDGFFISRTICHNPSGTGSHKLYYYDNTHLFYCYTDCGDKFDIFELTMKIKKLEGINYNLVNAIAFVAKYFGYADDTDFTFSENQTLLSDWRYFQKKESEQDGVVIHRNTELKHFNENILKYLPSPRILPWEQEGITNQIIQDHNIKYDPASHGIVIPHYDINNNLIGIRERTLITDLEQYGKYKPAILANVMYNHPLSFNLYNLNHSYKQIQAMKMAIVFESEKSCLKYASFFGAESDISVAICGSNFVKYQFNLLLELGVSEVVIALDRQFKKIGDLEFKRWVKKMESIASKYQKYCTITFIFDTQNLLDYKDAPIDKGPDIFIKLFQNRLNSKGKAR